MIKKLSLLIGFTETEIKVILFLIITLAAGFGYKTLIDSKESSEYKNFDYSMEDSLFAEHNLTGNPEKEKIDYKQEVLDFNERNFQESKSDSELAEKSININKADVNELEKLPGIGTKTAERIVKYRVEKGDFKRIEDLLQVKGIGQSKLNDIKKYIFVN